MLEIEEKDVHKIKLLIDILYEGWSILKMINFNRLAAFINLHGVLRLLLIFNDLTLKISEYSCKHFNAQVSLLICL